MFPHELADPSVRSPCFLNQFRFLAKASHRFAAFLYTPEGKVVTKRIWEETLAELDFAGVRAILDSVGSNGCNSRSTCLILCIIVLILILVLDDLVERPKDGEHHRP